MVTAEMVDVDPNEEKLCLVIRMSDDVVGVEADIMRR